MKYYNVLLTDGHMTMYVCARIIVVRTFLQFKDILSSPCTFNGSDLDFESCLGQGWGYTSSSDG